MLFADAKASSRASPSRISKKDPLCRGKENGSKQNQLSDSSESWFNQTS
jgi:hypothetical protein